MRRYTKYNTKPHYLTYNANDWGRPVAFMQTHTKSNGFDLIGIYTNFAFPPSICRNSNNIWPYFTVRAYEPVQCRIFCFTRLVVVLILRGDLREKNDYKWLFCFTGVEMNQKKWQKIRKTSDIFAYERSKKHFWILINMLSCRKETNFSRFFLFRA